MEQTSANVHVNVSESVARHLLKTCSHPTLLEAVRSAPRHPYARGHRRTLSLSRDLARTLSKHLTADLIDLRSGDLSGIRPEALRRARTHVDNALAE